MFSDFLAYSIVIDQVILIIVVWREKLNYEVDEKEDIHQRVQDHQILVSDIILLEGQ
jgi:hypothetical protein